ncbi:MAG: glycine hydroxymethyltransferase [Chlamydiales bacterium]|nr:glycine hydroxymethyltransferase [Chlamydiales bacterium]
MTRLDKYLSQTSSDQRCLSTIAYLASLDHIQASSSKVAGAIEQELRDQRSYLKLIASENYSSMAVQLAMGNLLTDKYAEGFVQHRFYAGCDNVDAVEAEANDQLKRLFGSDHAYVQPHSGCDANLVAFWTILTHRIQNPEIERLGKKSLDELSDVEYEKLRQLLVNQKVMGLSLNSGGHLTHGYRHNVSSKMMRAVTYEVDPVTGLLNYDQIAAKAKQERPTILLAGYSAYPRKINFAKMREIADSVGAVFMVDMAHFAGLVAGKVFEGEYNPVPYAHIVTSTSHKTLRGPRGGFILCKGEFADSIDKGCPLVLGGPLPHVMAAKAIAFKEANTPEFEQYAHRIVDNAAAMAEQLISDGERVLTGGTDNHLMVIDITRFGLTGRQAEQVLREAHINVNRNAIPNDQNGPWYTSGIRVGTPATTTLGMGVEEMREIAHIIVDVLSNTRPAIVPSSGQLSKAKYVIDEAKLINAKQRVHDLLGQFPLYPEIPNE